MDVFVKTTYANIYDKPTFTSSMTTQALLWEKLEIISSEGSWFKVRQWDRYEGWVHSFYITDEKKIQKLVGNINDYRLFHVTQPIMELRESISLESNVICYATLGSQILVDRDSDCFILPSGKTVWANINKFSSDEDFESSFISLSSNLQGYPYLWGGKTPFGFDCSGLVQTIFKSMGIMVSRDTSMQIDDVEFMDIENDKYEIGDVIFFNIDSDSVDHVGLYFGDDMVMHCGGEVKLESLSDKLDKVVSLRRYKNKNEYKYE